jgi:hypothetical protein
MPEESTCFASTSSRSNQSFPYSAFLMFSTISGNLLLARSRPRHHNWIGFWHSFGTAMADDIATEANYFERNAARMGYPTPKFRQQGLFVGSGVIEAGCNAECIVTRSLPVGSPPVSHFEDFLLGIKGAARSNAISLSVHYAAPEEKIILSGTAIEPWSSQPKKTL